MSQSPHGSELPGTPEEASAEEAYAMGWAGINKLMRRGYSWSGHERNCAYLNLGDGRFANASTLLGFDDADDGRALATIDWDQDGDTDLFVTNRNGPRLRYFENRIDAARDSGPAPALRLRLEGRGANRGAIGARVEVVLRGPGEQRDRIVRGLRAGEGYLAQSSAWLHVGLGERAVHGVQVRWPGGAREAFEGIVGAGAYRLVEGSGRALAWEPGPPRGALGAGAGDAHTDVAEDVQAAAATGDAQAEAALGRRIVLAEPLPLPSLVLRTREAEELTLFGVGPGGAGTGTGRSVLLALWASWCPPCVAELTALREQVAGLEERGLAFLALSVDEDPAQAEALMERIGWPLTWAHLDPESARVLDGIHGALLDTEVPLPLPSAFLVDAEGRLRAIHVGPLAGGADALAEDLRLLATDAARALEEATPFPGRWHRRPSFGLDFFEPRLARRGLQAAATAYARASYQVKEVSRAGMLHEFGREAALAGRTQEAIATLRRALTEDPEYRPALFDLGQLLHVGGKPFDAIGLYRRLLELEPDHLEARFNLALAYAGTRQLRSARRELEELERRDATLAAELAPVIEALEAEGVESE